MSVTNPGSPLKFGSVSQTLASLSIGAGASVVFTSRAASGSLSEERDGTKAPSFSGVAANSTVVPEPGTFGLLAGGTLGVLRRGRVPRGRGERLMRAGIGG